MGDGAAVAEEMFAASGDGVEFAELHTDPGGEFGAGLHGCGQGGRHGSGSLAAVGKSAELDDVKLTDALPQSRLCAGCAALLDAGLNGGDGAAVGVEQMFDDLLDTPFFGIRDWSRLSVAGIQPAKNCSYFSIQSA